MRLLVVNVGSSSLKLRLLGDYDELLADRELPAQRGRFDEAAATSEIKGIGAVEAVGHRVVHGGPRLQPAARIDGPLLSYLWTLVDLAPLHQRAALDTIAAVGRVLPEVPAVACFDTAFHRSMPPEAATYALPLDWRQRFGLRRYGFHGLSHAYAARRAEEMLGRQPGELRIVTCHLGAGASLAAVREGASVDTTMGFTPLEGLVMATRSGSVDPGLVLWLQQQQGLTAAEINDALEHRSGLMGLTGTADMREVLAAAESQNAAACLARDVYVHSLRAGIAAMAAAMGGIEALVFTGGVGEHAAEIRLRAVSGLRFLGLEMDPERNRAGSEDAILSPARAGATTLVVRAREDIEIARQVRLTLSG